MRRFTFRLDKIAEILEAAEGMSARGVAKAFRELDAARARADRAWAAFRAAAENASGVRGSGKKIRAAELAFSMAHLSALHEKASAEDRLMKAASEEARKKMAMHADLRSKRESLSLLRSARLTEYRRAAARHAEKMLDDLAASKPWRCGDEP